MLPIPEPKIITSRRSSIALQITKEGEIIVKAPLLTPKFIIKKFLEEKRDWIEKSLEKIEKIKPIQKIYKNGEEYYFLGKPYKLQITDQIEISIKDSTLFFPKVFLFRAQKEITNWYIRQARGVISGRVEEHAKRMHLSYKSLLFSDTKSKWGTCFPDNSLQFNWRLIMAPIMVIDYVVIHELVHTIEKNHQDSFWRKVKLYTPAYKQHRKWLERNTYLLSV